MSYITENFMLQGENAKKLYAYAKDMPIFDYHCHLSEYELLENKPFENITQIWLYGDHYKWRMMRFYGISERLITGDATDREKFDAYLLALSTAYGNPLQHWSQMELEKYFNCTLELCPENADAIWEQANATIKAKNMRPSDCVECSGVKYLYTTNEVFDDLAVFSKLKEKYTAFTVAPAFRADKLMAINNPLYNSFIDKLEALTNKISGFDDLLAAVEKRLTEFKKAGCRAADIAVEDVYPVPTKNEAAKVFDCVRSGGAVSASEANVFAAYMVYFLMGLYARNDIVTELHIGPMRNNNSVMLGKIGVDAGFDTIGRMSDIRVIAALFNKLNSENALPKTVVFNLNPNMNAELIALSGCFQDDSAKSKINYGAAWWFLDNKPGMEKHLTDLCALGHIGAFIGMLTDSRSFVSYPRHDYFRRILCSFLGKMMDDGLMTSNVSAVGKVVRDICFNNAVHYFGLDK